jgi:hypothetical protein
MKRGLLLAAIVLPTVAFAQAPAPRLRYDYVSGMLAIPNLDELGAEISGSTAVTERFVVFGRYSSFEPRDGIDFETMQIGVSRIWNFRRNIDFVGSLAYADNEFDTPTRQGAKDQGVIFSAELRGWATPRLELSGATRIDRSRSSGSNTIVEVGAQYLTGPRLSYGGRIEADEDDTTLFLGVRFYFGASRRPIGQ